MLRADSLLRNRKVKVKITVKVKINDSTPPPRPNQLHRNRFSPDRLHVKRTAQYNVVFINRSTLFASPYPPSSRLIPELEKTDRSRLFSG